MLLEAVNTLSPLTIKGGMWKLYKVSLALQRCLSSKFNIADLNMIEGIAEKKLVLEKGLVNALDASLLGVGDMMHEEKDSNIRTSRSASLIQIGSYPKLLRRYPFSCIPPNLSAHICLKMLNNDSESDSNGSGSISVDLSAMDGEDGSFSKSDEQKAVVNENERSCSNVHKIGLCCKQYLEVCQVVVSHLTMKTRKSMDIEDRSVFSKAYVQLPIGATATTTKTSST